MSDTVTLSRETVEALRNFLNATGAPNLYLWADEAAKCLNNDLALAPTARPFDAEDDEDGWEAKAPEEAPDGE